MVNKIVQGAMRAQVVKFAGCLIWTQLWSAEADHKYITLLTFLSNSEKFRHIIDG